jgi:hypothetical protein
MPPDSEFGCIIDVLANESWNTAPMALREGINDACGYLETALGFDRFYFRLALCGNDAYMAALLSQGFPRFSPFRAGG